MVEQLTRREVVAFRLAAQHLADRASEEQLLDVAGRCGIQNSPPGSALLALGARVRGVDRGRVDAAITDERSLVQTWSMRGAPFFFPTSDAPVFTTGVLPPTEAALRRFLPGAVQPLDDLGIGLGDAADLTQSHVVDVLAGRRLDIGALGVEIAPRIARSLSPRQRDLWQAEGPYAAGQPLGEGIVHFCIRVLTLRGVVCFAPRAGNTAPFVLVDEWLGHPIPDVDPALARAELLRRYLRSYGPSTRGDFAAWLGVGARDADAWWDHVRGELTEVEFGRRAWVLTEDLDALQSAPTATGVRLLPPGDPYTQMRDRDTIVPDAHRRSVWRAVGAPGTVLVDGEIVGTWRAAKRGRALTVTTDLFEPVGDRGHDLLREEAERVGVLRGAATVAVVDAPSGRAH